MKIALRCSQEDREVLVTILVPLGKHQIIIKPGGSALGLSYDELMRLGTALQTFPHRESGADGPAPDAAPKGQPSPGPPPPGAPPESLNQP